MKAENKEGKEKMEIPKQSWENRSLLVSRKTFLFFWFFISCIFLISVISCHFIQPVWKVYDQPSYWMQPTVLYSDSLLDYRSKAFPANTSCMYSSWEWDWTLLFSSPTSDPLSGLSLCSWPSAWHPELPAFWQDRVAHLASEQHQRCQHKVDQIHHPKYPSMVIPNPGLSQELFQKYITIFWPECHFPTWQARAREIGTDSSC